MSIQVSRRDGVAVVTIDRPEARNALDRATLHDLRDGLRKLADDAGTRAVVVTGAGDRAFIAGADIREMSGMSPAEGRAFGELGHEIGRLLETMPKPTIAAVNGFALGGGCEVALACDIRYAADTAKLGLPEVGLGIIPGWGGTQRLARLVGLGVAKELVLTGRIVDAAEALERGLVNAVFPPEELLPKTIELAESLAAKSPLALAAAKEALNRSLQALEPGLEREVELFAGLFESDDRREGMAAFVEKRAPRFTGR